MSNIDTPTAAKRCAIYTRKSFQPPMGQEITSLDSQRTICSSFIVSQQHRGWVEIARRYDDSGRTGAHANRPALQQLLADVEAGLVDVVLVYKLDRLTRTLLDFVRLMDFLQRHGVALVSITQNFDTSDSLGRLVLNVLLTFAQFEREITSDRMRDKIRVLREMGRWVGGAPPLGYDVIDKKLVENPVEGPLVRTIFQTYVETRSIEAVHRKLQAMGAKRKVWKSQSGKVWGGGPILATSLHHVLRNPIYAGDVRHRGEKFPGIHKPLVERTDFDRIQCLLAEHSARHPKLVSNLLNGLIYDSAGRAMCVRSSSHKGRENRYYASVFTAWAKRGRLKRMRANADELENIILAALKCLLVNREQIRGILLEHGVHGRELDRLTRAGSSAARRLDDASVRQISDVLKGLFQRVELTTEHVTVIIFREELRRFLAWDGVGIFGVDHEARRRNGGVHFLRIASTAVRFNRLFALPVTPTPSTSKTPDERLVGLLDRAKKAQRLMLERRDLNIGGLASEFGCRMRQFSRLVRLNYLAPDIMLSIRDGTQPRELTPSSLMKTDLPLDWAIQRKLLGYAAQPEHFRNPDRSAAEANSGTTVD